MAQFNLGLPGLTPVVKNLLIINVLVFLLQLFFQNTHLSFYGTAVNFDDLFALHYWRSSEFRVWQLVTHMFLHGGFEHIIFNMFALWMFGNIVENYLGSQRFIVLYFICGIGAALCQLTFYSVQMEPAYKAFQIYQTNPTLDQFDLFLHSRVPVNKTNWGNVLYNLRADWMQNPGSANYPNLSISTIQKYFSGAVWPGSITYVPGIFDEAMLGASGAVMGVVFAFSFLFPNAILLIFGIIPLKAKYSVLLYAVYDIYNGLRNTDNIAHFAHLGGMLFAFLLLKMWHMKSNNRIY